MLATARDADEDDAFDWPRADCKRARARLFLIGCRRDDFTGILILYARGA